MISKIPTKSRNPVNTLLPLLKPLCLQFNAEAINRCFYLELVPCDVSEEESETSTPEPLHREGQHNISQIQLCADAFSGKQ